MMLLRELIHDSISFHFLEVEARSKKNTPITPFGVLELAK